MKDSENHIRAFFPTVLLDEERVVDPYNLEFIYQYYLLENLAVNLVKDKKKYVFGYAPSIAKSWEVINNSIIFNIDENAKWSNGKQINLDHILFSLKNAIKNKSRHLVLLRLAKEINKKLDQNQIELIFEKKPNINALLHELSLADTSIVNAENLKGDWSISSGPYSLEKFSKSDMSFRLKKNQFYTSDINYPDIVDASYVTGRENLSKLNSKFNFDIVYLGGHSFKNAYTEMITDYELVKKSYNTSIHMFVFNEEHKLSKDLSIRQEFASIVEEVKLNIIQHNTTELENQIIPTGFLGRLSNYTFPKKDIQMIKSVNGIVEIDNTFQDLKGFKDAFQSFVESKSLSIKFKYSQDIEKKDKHNVIAKLISFKGNMKDPIGSFSFLLSGYSAQSELLNKRLERISIEADESIRNLEFEEFHRFLLDQAYFIPLLNSPTMVLLKNEIDISNWNLFDMRLRFYELSINN